MKSLRIKNSILCEYVAQGVGNKHVLVNVYSGEIIIASLPGRLHLGFYVEIIKKGTPLGEMTIEAFVGRKRIGYISTEIEDGPGDLHVLVIPFIPVPIEAPGKLRLVASGDNFRRTTLMEKKVRLIEPSDPNVLQLLSGRSPPDAPGSSSPPEPSPRGSPKKRRRS